MNKYYDVVLLNFLTSSLPTNLSLYDSINSYLKQISNGSRVMPSWIMFPKNFGALSPDQIINKKKNIKKKNIVKQKQLDGGAMLFKKSTFKKIKGFDEKIFLYYEENDFYHKCHILRYDLFLIRNAFFYHSQKGDSSSAIYSKKEEKYYAYLIGGWHGQWSKFYYLKKYNGFFYSFVKCLPNLITNIIKLILKSFVDYKKAKYIYFKIEGVVCSIIGIPSFKRNKYDKFV